MSRHTKASKGTVFIHNSDLSGDVTIVVPHNDTTQRLSVPADDLLQFVAQHIIDLRIAKLEQVDWRTVIGEQPLTEVDV